MTTPPGGSPDAEPDPAHGRVPEPDPDVTSFSAPPQDPPPSWPGSDAPPATPSSRGWSEEGAPVDEPGAPTAAWTPHPPADATRAGWPSPPPDPRAGFAAPPAWAPSASAPPSWPAADSAAAQPGAVPSRATGAPPTWGPGQQGRWAAPRSQPGRAQAPGPGAAPEQPGWTPPAAPAWGVAPEQPGWGPPSGGPVPQQGGWGPPPGPHPTQIGTPWAPPQPWGAPPPGWAPPPPPRRTGRLVALIAVGVLLLAGLGVGGYLLVRETGAGGPGPAEVPADFRPITTGTLSYAVPPGWTDSPDTLSVLGAPFEGRADAPGYDCGGARYFRGLAASTFVPGERPAAAVATAFARETGRVFYVAADDGLPDVQVSDARPFDVDGVPGQLVEATSTTPVDDGCLATSGTVLLLAVPTTGPDGSPGTAVLVVNGDTAGGPPTAPPLADRAILDAVLNSARLPSI